MKAKKFNLYIYNLDNAAFADDLKTELARCLINTATRILTSDMQELEYYQNIKDSNGDIVGQFAIKLEEL